MLFFFFISLKSEAPFQQCKSRGCLSVCTYYYSYAWAVPALYQRYGAVLLLAAALLAQVPLLGVGSWLWRDARTQSLGAIFATLGSMGTPLTVLGLEAVALSLGFYPGRPRDWHPRPFKYLLDTVSGTVCAQPTRLPAVM